MSYTVSLLNNPADCQALINIANAEKENLVYKRTGLMRQRQSATINSAGIEAELASVNAELGILQQILDTVPEGPLKEEARRKYKKADYKKSLLEGRKANYGVLALLEKEYDIACIDKDITESDAFIAAVTVRMGEVD